MGKLTEEEIRKIIKRASVFQKFSEQSPHNTAPFLKDDFNTIYEISDSLNLKRQFVNEALLEHEGIPIEDPISIDTGNQSDVEILAQANGIIDGGLLNELRAQLEYHFNTVGKIARRKNRVFWKAKPAGPSKFFDITSSPQLELENSKGSVKLKLTQNLRTYNKLFLPIAALSFGAFMMFASIVYGVADNDGVAPMLIISAMFLTGSFFFARFIKKKKLKRKESLKELMEILQQTIERRFRTSSSKEKKKERINIPDLDGFEEDITVTSSTKLKT